MLFLCFFMTLVQQYMEKTNVFHGRHCIYNLHVHLVFVVKYRRKVFTSAILKEQYSFLSVLDLNLNQLNSPEKKLLVIYPSKVAISELVHSLKGTKSLLIRKKNYPTIRQKLLGKALLSPSYFAGSCGGAPISIIKQYIEQQNTPDQKNFIFLIGTLHPRTEVRGFVCPKFDNVQKITEDDPDLTRNFKADPSKKLPKISFKQSVKSFVFFRIFLLCMSQIKLC